jgi:hypothetical protein
MGKSWLFEHFSWLGPRVPGRGVVVVAHGDVHRQAFICVLAVIVIFSIWVISTSIHGEIVGYIYLI